MDLPPVCLDVEALESVPVVLPRTIVYAAFSVDWVELGIIGNDGLAVNLLARRVCCPCYAVSDVTSLTDRVLSPFVVYVLVFPGEENISWMLYESKHWALATVRRAKAAERTGRNAMSKAFWLRWRALQTHWLVHKSLYKLSLLCFAADNCVLYSMGHIPRKLRRISRRTWNMWRGIQII